MPRTRPTAGPPLCTRLTTREYTHEMRNPAENRELTARQVADIRPFESPRPELRIANTSGGGLACGAPDNG